jgi:hypothetical protein
MLLLLLATLASTPSATSLAEAGALRGALVEVQVTAPDPLPYSQMSRAQLKAEYRVLDDGRPPIAGAITAIVFGGVAMAAGALTMWFTFILSAGSLFRTVPLTPLLIGAGLLLGGVGVLVIGIVMLRASLAERKPFNERMDEIQSRLDGTWEGPPPDPYQPVPPPPPPPPRADLFESVRPSLVVATF